MIYHENINCKGKTWVIILISDKVGFRVKKITISKKGHYTIFKGSVYQEHIIIWNGKAANNRASKYMKQNWQSWKKQHTNPQL